MAQYATEAEFLGQALPTEAFTTLPAGTINRALIGTSATANSYIKKRYTLPLVSWGEDLRSAVCDLAALQVMRFRGFKPGSGASQTIIDAAAGALAWLREIAKGEAELSDCVDSTPEEDEAGPLASSDPSADFEFFVSAEGQEGGEDPFA